MTETLHILIVDDNEDDRQLYCRSLQKNAETNYDIAEMEDGEQGMTHLRKHVPDCILLDYSLPGRNGLEVLKRIRSRHPFIPVVMLTGQGNEAVAVAAIQEGAQNYIAKAMITPEALQRVVRVAIEHCAMQKRIHEQRTSLEVFTRALAHDLKEPVRTILSFLDLLVAHQQMSEKGKSYFDFVYNAAMRMSALIDTVYFYTRLDGSNGESSREICDIADVLRDTKENIRELIRSRNARIAYDMLPALMANRMQMIQVFQNLLCNAIRYCEATPAIHINAEEKEDHWLFRVADNGCGMEEKFQESAFEPFKRLSNQKEQGLGLGLAVCKKIIESHGGRIWYESRLGEGTTFLFTLPKAAQNEVTSATLSAKASAPKHSRNGDESALAGVLLVEDNDADVELTRILLMEEGRLHCNLVVARSGREALAILRGENPEAGKVDLVLLDINMPGMDGFELLEQLRQESAMLPLPVVMCTTSAYDRDMERAKALGAVGYLTKPAELTKLRPVIEGSSNLRLRRRNNGYALLRAA